MQLTFVYNYEIELTVAICRDCENNVLIRVALSATLNFTTVVHGY